MLFLSSLFAAKLASRTLSGIEERKVGFLKVPKCVRRSQTHPFPCAFLSPGPRLTMPNDDARRSTMERAPTTLSITQEDAVERRHKNSPQHVVLLFLFLSLQLSAQRTGRKKTPLLEAPNAMQQRPSRLAYHYCTFFFFCSGSFRRHFVSRAEGPKRLNATRALHVYVQTSALPTRRTPAGNR